VEPSEDELREIAKELQGMKSKAQSMAHPLIRSENPATANQAFEMMQGVEKISRDQKRICMLLRRLGGDQEGSKTSGVKTPVATARITHTGRAEGGQDFSFRSRSGKRCPGLCAGGDQRMPQLDNRGLASLFKNLEEAQANDSGWPFFNGKYMTYP
jgi:hypothetical protein